MKKQVSAGIVVYTYTGNGLEYLLLHYLGGHWDFPKGKLEDGETWLEAALRELEEETGIDDIQIHRGFLESFSYRFKDYDGVFTQKTVYFFVGLCSGKSVVLSHEHQGYEWLVYPEAHQRLTFKNARDLLQLVDAFLDEKGYKKKTTK